MELDRLTQDFALANRGCRCPTPIAINKRSGLAFSPGIGPHSVVETYSLMMSEARRASPERYLEVHAPVPYPANPRQKCDARIGLPQGSLYVEGKLLRLKGDNGLPKDNMLMHILSPYPHHRSALSDCMKLARSAFDGHKGIVMVGYAYRCGHVRSIPRRCGIRRVLPSRPTLGSSTVTSVSVAHRARPGLSMNSRRSPDQACPPGPRGRLLAHSGSSSSAPRMTVRSGSATLCASTRCLRSPICRRARIRVRRLHHRCVR